MIKTTLQKSALSILLISTTVLTGCFSSPSVKEGDTVTIQYTMTTLSGEVIESTEGTSGKIITVGTPNTFIPIIHQTLIGMKEGDAKTMTITPKEGYGSLYDNNKIHRLSLVMMKNAGINPLIGGVQDLGGIKGVIKTIEGTGDSAQIVVDFNPRQTWSDVSLSFNISSIQSK